MNSLKVIKIIFSLLDKKLKLFGIFIFILLLFTSFVETFSIASIAPVISSISSQNESTILIPFIPSFLSQDLNSKFKLTYQFLLKILRKLTTYINNFFDTHIENYKYKRNKEKYESKNIFFDFTNLSS